MTRRLRNEEGSAMALALAFLSLFGVFVASVLNFSETGLRGTEAFRARAQTLAGADAVLDGAINRVRSDVEVGREGADVTCFAPPSIDGASVAVRCQGQTGSGLATRTTQDDLTKPRYAILTLGQSPGGEDGLVKTVGGSALSVTGDVFSNSTVNVTGSMSVAGTVGAVGTCTGTITASGGKACANVGTAPSPVADPAYPKATSTVPTARAVPSCGSGWLITFQPGTYNDAAALTSLTQGSCAGKVLHFTPGVYYFDFTVGTNHTWRVNDANATLIGGTPLGWSTGAASRPTITVPGGCDATASGVQFLFGGDSRFSVDAGDVEVCASPSTTEQRIAIYGVRSGAGGPTTTTTLTPSGVSSASFVPNANARLIDGSEAAAAIVSGASPASATATATGFAALPAGAVLSQATLRVAHREAPIGSVSAVDATVTPTGGAPVTVSIPKSNTLATDTVDLLAAGMPTSAGANGFSVSYTVAGKKNTTLTGYLDGIELAVAYTTPTFRAQNGCITTTPYTGSNGAACSFLASSGTHSSLVVHGTVYAPLGVVDLDVTNQNLTRIDRGIIARAMMLRGPSSSRQIGPPVDVPGASGPRTDRDVVLEAKVGGVPVIRARVVFGDGGGSTPGATVTIQEWSVM